MITPEVDLIKAHTERAFAPQFADGRLGQLGVYNRRKIAGSNTWSQHAWGNAWDIKVTNMETGDLVFAWLAAKRNLGTIPIGTILWRVSGHYDHIHVEGKPKRTGTPPLNVQTVGDEMELTKMIQEVLRAEGYLGADGKPLNLDGVIGANTRHAFDAMVQDARDGGGGLPSVASLVDATVSELVRRLGA